MIKVSIITPSLNQARFLPEALQSIDGQDYPQIRHLAIDGGSTDGSVDILSDWKQRDLRLISEPDCGPADAVNKGWRVASGAIIACLHADQLQRDFSPSWHFERNPNCRAVYGRTALLKEDGTPDDEYPTGPWDYNRLLNERICRQPAVFWRSGASSDFGVFDERLRSPSTTNTGCASAKRSASSITTAAFLPPSGDTGRTRRAGAMFARTKKSSRLSADTPLLPNPSTTGSRCWPAAARPRTCA